MTRGGAAGRPAASTVEDPAGAAGVTLRWAGAAALVAVVAGQAPPLLANVTGAGLAVSTQVRAGWLYTMAGHAASIEIAGASGSLDGVAGGTFSIRFGFLSIAVLAGAVLAVGSRAAARRVGDAGARRAVVGATIAVPYAIALGVVNLFVTLRLEPGGAFLGSPTSISVPAWEGFVLPAALGVVVGALGGWSVSRSWRGSVARVAAAGLRSFTWALGLALVGLLAFAALRPAGLERYATEVWSAGTPRAALYLGHQTLLLPNAAVWVLAPAMGGCVTIRDDGAARDLVCLDRLPRGPDPAAWFLSELGRVEGESPTTPAPVAAWIFVFVPAAAIVLGVRTLGPVASSWRSAFAMGAAAGAVFALAVTVVSLAASLWLSSDGNAEARLVALGPDPLTTGVLALVWGVVGGVAVSVASRRFSPRG